MTFWKEKLCGGSAGQRLSGAGGRKGINHKRGKRQFWVDQTVLCIDFGGFIQTLGNEHTDSYEFYFIEIISLKNKKRRNDNRKVNISVCSPNK